MFTLKLLSTLNFEVACLKAKSILHYFKVPVCFLIFLLTTQLAGYAQPVLSWDRTKNASANVEDRGFNIIVDDSSKNVYVASRSIGVNTNYDILTIKYTASGQELWANRFPVNGNLAEEPVAIKLNGLNGVFVLGKSINTSGADEMRLIKYDTLGNPIWDKLFNNGTATGDDIPKDLIFDDFGNIYVVGSSVTSGSGGQHYPVLIKYTSDGMFVWAKTYNNVGPNESAVKVKLNHIPNLVLLVTNTDEYTLGILEVGLNDGVVIREYISQDVGHNVDILGIPNDLLVDPSNGNMWVLGTDGESNTSESRVYTCKYNYGNVEHLTRTSVSFPSSGNVVGVALSFDKDKNVYSLIEVYNGIIKHYIIKKNVVAGNAVWIYNYFGPGGQDYIPVSMMVEEEISSPSIYVGGYNESGDIFIAKHNSDDIMKGDTAWTIFYDCGNHQPDVASAFVQDDYDNFYITGYSSCNGTGNDIKTIKYCLNVPNIPDAISGPTNACAGDTVLYSVSTDTSVESYDWILPPGWVGQNEGAIIKAVAGNSGNLSVIANKHGCSSEPKTIALQVLTIPNAPTEILGDHELCSGSNAVFSVPDVPGATSYTWHILPDWTGSSTSDLISVQTGLQSGNISVTANNVCGVSPEINLNITVTPSPSTPEQIIGDTILCDGDELVLSVMPEAGVHYVWTIPLGWGVESDTGSTIIVYPEGSNTISVHGVIGNCISGNQSLDITSFGEPDLPASINGQSDICDDKEYSYFINEITGATSYSWTWPLGWIVNITSDTSILVRADSSGTIYVTANNMCDTSQSQQLSIVVHSGVPNTPGPIMGIDSVCIGDTVHFAIDTVPNSSFYKWIRPSVDWKFVGDSSVNMVTLIVGTLPGTVRVKAVNGCGESSTSNLALKECTVNTIDPQLAESIDMFPNPTNGEFILSSDEHEIRKVEIFDITGKLDYQYNYKISKSASFNLGTVFSGLYLVRIYLDNGIVTKRLVKL